MTRTKFDGSFYVNSNFFWPTDTTYDSYDIKLFFFSESSKFIKESSSGLWARIMVQPEKVISASKNGMTADSRNTYQSVFSIHF